MSEKFSDAPVVKDFINAVSHDVAADRPTQEDIIQTLMLCYNEKRDVIISWLREIKL